MIEAAKRLKTKCHLTIFTDSTYVAAGYQQGWLEKWEKDGWKNAKGKDIANMDEWKELQKLLEPHEKQFRTREAHPYRAWLLTETEKKAKENEVCTKNSENSTQ